MRRSPVLAALAIALCAFLARAEEAQPAADAPELPKNFDLYQEENETRCVGPAAGRQAAPTEYELGGFKYSIDGARAKIVRARARANPGQVRLGVVSAIKDDSPETRANLAEYLEKFKANDVDAIVVGGDTAFNENEIEEVMNLLAAPGVPVLAIIGNSESRSGFNRAVRAAHAKNRNVINLDLVRRVQADGYAFVTLPGYFDKRYVHATAACVYTPADAAEVAKLAQGLTGPVIALSHGPPRQSGKGAIDFVPETGTNIGDPALAAALTQANIVLGIFGHVLEAGGRGTDPSGKKEVKPLAFADALYLNPGSANSLPWRMNSGPESYGMAAVLTLEGKRAKYEIFRSPRRIALDE